MFYNNLSYKMSKKIISGSNVMSSPSMKMDPSTIGGNSTTLKSGTVQRYTEDDGAIQRIAA